MATAKVLAQRLAALNKETISIMAELKFEVFNQASGGR